MSDSLDSKAQSSNESANKGWFNRFLAGVEFLGNMLPHPITLLAIFCIVIVVFSGVADWFGLSAMNPRPEGSPGREPDGVIEVVSLLSAEGFEQHCNWLGN